MRLPIHAAAVAAALGLLTGTLAGAGIYHFLLNPELAFPSMLSIAGLLGITTSAFAALTTFLLVHWRVANSAPPMGALLGACGGLMVLALVTLVHAYLYPGAAGVFASFFGQLAVAAIVVGWFAALSGAALGSHINRIAKNRGA